MINSTESVTISIVMACYNSERTISEAISSVLKQNYKSLELIVVDGQSTDGTVLIIQKFAHKDKRIKWISEPDLGLYDAMNKGIAVCTGFYVGILNSDDFYADSDVVSKIVEALEKDTTVDAVYGNVVYVRPNNIGRVVRKYSSAMFKPTLFRWGFMPAHATFYCKRSLFEKYGTYKLGFKIASDFELLMRFIYVHGIKTSYLDSTLVVMRTGGVSTRGLRSKILLNKEIVTACRMNGVNTNMLMLTLKYFVKVFELKV